MRPTTADETPVSSDIAHSMRQVVDHVVDHVPGVIGALVSSADGFTLVARLPDDFQGDTDALGAMTAAALALSTRLVQITGDAPATVSHHRSGDAQVFVVAIAHIAALTLLATADADTEQLVSVGREAGAGLQRLFRGAAAV